ncbi:MAG: metal-dependent hydrolase [Spirochaetota bacterium]|nr:metal-dependent hydrolase [Spirochaetota bacterium]
MQAGHFAVALSIASYAPELTNGEMEAFSLESIAVAIIAHWLPNLDAIPIKLKWAKPSFHCTWSHSLLFSIVVSLILLLFNTSWAIITFVSLLIHYLADMPSSVGLPLLLPITNKRFSFRLWADTGYLGWETFKGSYIQAWPWILEGGAYLFLFVRAYQEAVWPFT